MKRLNVQDDLQPLPAPALREKYIQESRAEKVCCLNLKGDINIGQIVRTAELFAMSEVMLVGRKKYDRRTAVGAEFRIPVTKYWAAKGDHSEELDISTVLDLLRLWSEDHTIIFLEQGGVSLERLSEALLCCFLLPTGPLPPLFVLGSEHDGIPDEILMFTPALRVSIPQLGIGRSFNVSNAFAIVAWEYYRTRLTNNRE